MQLMTNQIIANTPGLYQTEETKIENKMVTAKFFCGGLTWYMTEYDPSTKLAFGYVENLVDPISSEWGYFSIREFQEYNTSKGFPMIERDLYFTPTTFKNLKVVKVW